MPTAWSWITRGSATFPRPEALQARSGCIRKREDSMSHPPWRTRHGRMAHSSPATLMLAGRFYSVGAVAKDFCRLVPWFAKPSAVLSLLFGEGFHYVAS